MEQDFLSDIELYYSDNLINSNSIRIEGEEFKHILKVMRHNNGDVIFVTDGKGTIFESVIILINQRSIECRIEKKHHFKNVLENFTVCIPRLKSHDRFEFALEKCVELGFTDFVVFESKRTIARGPKMDRWEKVLLSAMKQSLRSFLPKIKFEKNLPNISALKSQIVIFDQKSKNEINHFDFKSDKKYVLLFGPEGGLTNEEINQFDNSIALRLTENRLRAETAVITACSAIALNH